MSNAITTIIGKVRLKFQLVFNVQINCQGWQENQFKNHLSTQKSARLISFYEDSLQ